jgi:hypothetical protein
MNCKQANEVMDLFSSGALGGREEQAVRMHLADCAPCACKLRSLERIETLPALDEEIEPSGDFARRFHVKLEERRRMQHAAAQAKLPWRASIAAWGRPRQLAAVGTLAALLIAGIVWYGIPSGIPDPSIADSDLNIAEQLPLLQDMAVISNLDLLENFDAIENLSQERNGLEKQRSNP